MKQTNPNLFHCLVTFPTCFGKDCFERELGIYLKIYEQYFILQPRRNPKQLSNLFGIDAVGIRD